MNKSLNIKIPQVQEKRAHIRSNWLIVAELNISKAHFICEDMNTIPENKAQISQQHIFTKQLEKYIYPKKQIAILNAFPLFLYEYLRKEWLYAQ